MASKLAKVKNSDDRDIVKYIEFPVYDHKTGRAALHEADNSEFLKLVAIVEKNINTKK